MLANRRDFIRTGASGLASAALLAGGCSATTESQNAGPLGNLRSATPSDLENLVDGLVLGNAVPIGQDVHADEIAGGGQLGMLHPRLRTVAGEDRQRTVHAIAQDTAS